MTSHETTDPAPAPSRTHDRQPGPEAPEPHGLSGLDMLRATLKGTLPDASIMNTMSFRLTDVAEGFVAFEGTRATTSSTTWAPCTAASSPPSWTRPSARP